MEPFGWLVNRNHSTPEGSQSTGSEIPNANDDPGGDAEPEALSAMREELPSEAWMLAK